MSYGFRSKRTSPDKKRYSGLAGSANKNAGRDIGGSIVNGTIALVEEVDGFFGEASFIANKRREGDYVGRGRNFLFCRGEPLRWVVPVEVQLAVAPDKYRNNGRTFFIPRLSDVVMGVPGIRGNEEDSPIELKEADQVILEQIVNAIKSKLPTQNCF